MRSARGRRVLPGARPRLGRLRTPPCLCSLSGRVEEANLFSSVLFFGALSACILLDSLLLMFHPQHNCSLHSAHTFPRFAYSNCSWHSCLKFFHHPSGAVLIYVPAPFVFVFVLWVEHGCVFLGRGRDQACGVPHGAGLVSGKGRRGSLQQTGFMVALPDEDWAPSGSALGRPVVCGTFTLCRKDFTT